MARRRMRDEGSIYQRKSDGRYVGVVDLGFVNGKRVRKTVTAKTKRELTPKFQALNDSLGSGIDDDALTVEAWVTKWLDEVAPQRIRPSTLHTYELYARKWINPHLGRTRLSKLRPDQIRSMLRAMEDAGKSDATRRQVLAILRRALKVAVQDELIARNPASALDAPPVGKGSHGKFTLQEAIALLNACDSPAGPNSRWICALLAGIRRGEALGLRWEHVDLKKGVMTIAQAGQRIHGEGMQVVPLKSASAYRRIPLVEPARAALEAMPHREGFVWGEGEKMRTDTVDRNEWNALLDAAEGVPRRPMHAARATTASLLSEAGVPAKIIAEIMGHSQVQVTEKHYIHGDAALHASAMGRLGELIAPVESPTRSTR